MNTYLVTGTSHRILINAENEDEARRLFHNFFNGESITNVKISVESTWP